MGDIEDDLAISYQFTALLLTAVAAILTWQRMQLAHAIVDSPGPVRNAAMLR